jgi:hypothetical protein
LNFREIDGEDVDAEVKNGATQLLLPGKPFTNCHPHQTGIRFTIRLLETMHSLGYDYLFSSDLSSTSDLSSLFFKKTPVTCNGRDAIELVCVTPEGGDKILLLNHNEQVVLSIRKSVDSSWQWGIHSEQEGHAEHVFRLNGNPWVSTKNSSVPAVKLMLEIVADMSAIGYKLHANVNIKVNKIKLFQYFFNKRFRFLIKHS